jgi:hypothetical protein
MRAAPGVTRRRNMLNGLTQQRPSLTQGDGTQVDPLGRITAPPPAPIAPSEVINRWRLTMRGGEARVGAPRGTGLELEMTGVYPGGEGDVPPTPNPLGNDGKVQPREWALAMRVVTGDLSRLAVLSGS